MGTEVFVLWTGRELKRNLTLYVFSVSLDSDYSVIIVHKADRKAEK